MIGRKGRIFEAELDGGLPKLVYETHETLFVHLNNDRNEIIMLSNTNLGSIYRLGTLDASIKLMGYDFKNDGDTVRAVFNNVAIFESDREPKDIYAVFFWLIPTIYFSKGWCRRKSLTRRFYLNPTYTWHERYE